MNEPAYIPLSVPNLRGKERDYALDCIDTGWISSVGKYVKEFEEKFASYTGAPGAVAASCGTAALHLALLAAGVKEDEEVLVPALTFIAPVNAISYIGAKQVFVDSEESSFGMSPASVEEFIATRCVFDGETLLDIESGRRVSAMIPVHLMGRACDMDKLCAIAKARKLTLIEDAAEGIGCLYKGRHVGTFGLAGCFSFNGNKTLTTGGGGMAVSAEPELLKKMKHLSTQAKSDELLFEHDEIGYNYRMNNVQAALGVAQLERLDAMIGRKIELHKLYESRLAEARGLKLLTASADCRSACWMAVLKTKSLDERNVCLKHFEKARIQARPFWALNSGHPMYRSCQRTPLPVAEELLRTCVCVPCSSTMSDEDAERVISTALSFAGA